MQSATPFDIATCMYYTGVDPFTKQEASVAKRMRDRKMQRALMQFFKAGNYFEVRDALLHSGRQDLIGGGVRVSHPGQSSEGGAPGEARACQPGDAGRIRPSDTEAGCEEGVSTGEEDGEAAGSEGQAMSSGDVAPLVRLMILCDEVSQEQGNPFKLNVYGITSTIYSSGTPPSRCGPATSHPPGAKVMIRDANEACQTPDGAFVIDRAIVVTALAMNAQTNLVYTPRVEASPQTCYRPGRKTQKRRQGKKG